MGRGDTVRLQIDTTLNADADADAARRSARPQRPRHHEDHAMVQLTYLQSYEQVGVLRGAWQRAHAGQPNHGACERTHTVHSDGR